MGMRPAIFTDFCSRLKRRESGRKESPLGLLLRDEREPTSLVSSSTLLSYSFRLSLLV